MYQPTHRRRTEGRTDAILYRNLCRNVERMLAEEVPGAASREILDRLRSYDCEEFWEDCGSADGLCVFAARGFQAAYRLPGSFPELEVVGATFHTKPLIRYLQSNSMTYYILSLNLGRVALYEGLGDSIREVPLKGVPLSLDGEGGRDGQKVQRGSRQTVSRRRSGDRVHFGQGGRREQVQTDLEKFFRQVAKGLWKNHLRASTRGVVLAAPAQHQALFRKVAQIPTLLDTGVVVDPTRLSPEDLRDEARRALEPEIQRRIQEATEEFGLARSRGHGTEILTEVATLVAAGRVKRLLVEGGRRIWGAVNAETGEIMPGERDRNVHDVDLLDELAELTLVRGGEVFVLTRDEMPVTSGIAAILRY